MTILIPLAAVALPALLSAAALAQAAPRPAKPLSGEQLREEMAYTIGVQAYLYGDPVVAMYRTRYAQVSDPANKQRTPPNRFRHRRRLLDHTFTAVVSPNNDTLYSSAWLDLSRGPVVLRVPETGGRYYTFQLLDFYTNTFAFVGKRATGTTGGAFAVAGPGWKGPLPEGVRRVDSPTNAVWLLGRTAVNGEADLPAVHALQDRYTLTPLGGEGERGGAAVPDKAPVSPPSDPPDALAFFEALNAGLRENPPPAREAALMSLFARIGVGPGRTLRAGRRDPATEKGLRRAVEAGGQIVAANPDRAGPSVNGWYFPPRAVGNFGDDYLLRAVTARTLLAALPPEEVVYPTTSVDDQGRPLHGKHRYVLRMGKGQAPPVDAFWSVTAYRLPERLFAANPLGRYAIGDRTKGLRYGQDGSLELYVRHDSPGKDRESNWLPAPPGDFCLTLRGWLPRKELRDGSWKVPPVRRLE
jgi:hypothetical protein